MEVDNGEVYLKGNYINILFATLFFTSMTMGGWVGFCTPFTAWASGYVWKTFGLLKSANEEWLGGGDYTITTMNSGKPLNWEKGYNQYLAYQYQKSQHLKHVLQFPKCAYVSLVVAPSVPTIKGCFVDTSSSKSFQSNFSSHTLRIVVELWKKPVCLGYIGDSNAQLYGDYTKPI